METENTTRKNPSRETCQKIIKRILVTEVLEKGCNEHFRQASDFMGYFQSLYPASDALTKQVQRAIKAMDMPRDERGYFIVNKTSEQFEQDKEISRLLQSSEASLKSLEESEPVLIEVPTELADYLMDTLSSSSSLQIRSAASGLLFFFCASCICARSFSRSRSFSPVRTCPTNERFPMDMPCF